MGITNIGLNKTKDLVNAALTEGQLGTGTSTTTPDDTALDEAVGATLKTLSNNTSDKLITTSFVLPTTDGNGLSFTEFENRFDTGEMLARIRHTPQSKDNTIEMTYVLTFEITGA